MEFVRKERMAYMDLAKFAAIVLVCIGHAYNLSSELDSKVLPVIYSFHMSLFMMMCGFFSSNSYKQPLKDFLIKKCRQLLIPSITVSLLLAVIAIFVGGRYGQELYGGVWFLKSLFACHIIVYTSKRLLSNDVLACVITSFLLFVLPYGGSLMVNYYLLFFWGGYFLRKYYRVYDVHIIAFTILSLFIFVLSIALDRAHVVDKVTLVALKTQPLHVLSEYVVGLSGSLACLGICRYICFRVKSNLVTIGQYTLGIYIVQTFVLERLAVSVKALHITATGALVDFFLIPMIGVLFTLLSYHIVRITCRGKWMNILVYGGQYKAV